MAEEEPVQVHPMHTHVKVSSRDWTSMWGEMGPLWHRFRARSGYTLPPSTSKASRRPPPTCLLSLPHIAAPIVGTRCFSSASLALWLSLQASDFPALPLTCRQMAFPTPPGWTWEAWDVVRLEDIKQGTVLRC